MGTVSAPALLGGLVDLDVLDDQVAGVETLGVGVGLGVLQEREEVLRGLHRPPGTVGTELLACRIPVLAETPIQLRPCMIFPHRLALPSGGEPEKGMYHHTPRSPSHMKSKTG